LEIYPSSDLEFSLDFFRSTFIQPSHLLACDFLGMVFEHLRDLSDLEDSTIGFHNYFNVFSCCYRSYLRAHCLGFGVARLLALAKLFGNIQL